DGARLVRCGLSGAAESRLAATPPRGPRTAAPFGPRTTAAPPWYPYGLRTTAAPLGPAHPARYTPLAQTTAWAGWARANAPTSVNMTASAAPFISNLSI